MNWPQTLAEIVRPGDIPPELVLPVLADLAYLALLAPETRIGLPGWLERLPQPDLLSKALMRELRALRGEATERQVLDDAWLQRVETASLAAGVVRLLPVTEAQQQHFPVPAALSGLCERLDKRDLTRLGGRADRAQGQGLGGQLPWRCVLRQGDTLQPPGSAAEAQALLADLRAGQLRKTQARSVQTALAHATPGWELLTGASWTPPPPPPPPKLQFAELQAPIQLLRLDRPAVFRHRGRQRDDPQPASSEVRLAVLVLRAELLASTAAIVVEQPETPLALSLLRGVGLFAEVSALLPGRTALVGWGAPRFLLTWLAGHLQRARVRLELTARRQDDLDLQVALATADAGLAGLTAMVALAAESRQVLLHDADLADPDAWWSTARLPGSVALRAPWPQRVVDPCGEDDGNDPGELKENEEA